MSKTIRILVYALITAIVIGGVWFVQPREPATPQGLFLSTIANGSQHSGVIGRISIMMTVNKHRDPTAQQKQLLDYAMQLATAHGADKVQVQAFVSTMSPSSGVPIYLLKALAVRSNP